MSRLINLLTTLTVLVGFAVIVYAGLKKISYKDAFTEMLGWFKSKKEDVEEKIINKPGGLF